MVVAWSMKVIMKRKIYRFTAFVLVMAMMLCIGGCAFKTEEEQTTTEEVVHDNPLEDLDGFTIINDYVKTTQGNVNVRYEASEDSKVYIVLDAGVDLHRTGMKDGWTRVNLNGGDFFLRSEFVEETTIDWATETNVEKVSHVVFIDPAKQITEDSTTEPMSPDITAPTMNDEGEYEGGGVGMKEKMTPAAMGVDSGVFEYDVTMTIANQLNAELVKRGYTVYMSRTSNNVNLSNAKRSEMANTSGAEIYIKLEASSSNDYTAKGVLGFITTSTNSNSGLNYQKNYELCYDVIKCVCEGTGADRMGIYETDNLTSLNYADIPATAINMGFLSNTEDDANLNDPEYQQKMAESLANGIDMYFEEVDQ